MKSVVITLDGMAASDSIHRKHDSRIEQPIVSPSGDGVLEYHWQRCLGSII